MLFGVKLVVDHAALGLADALDDDLAGGLGGDAAKILGLDLDADHVAQLGVGQGLPGLLQGDFGGAVVYGLHHVLFDVHAYIALVRVGPDLDVISRPVVVSLVGGGQCLGNFLHHISRWDTLLLFDLGNGGEKFLAVILAVVGLRFFSRH